MLAAPLGIPALAAAAQLPLSRGPFQPTSDSLKTYQAPAWFREPRPSRLIGAVYPENQPYAFMTTLRASAAYDAMLFVDKTTAAVPNTPRK